MESKIEKIQSFFQANSFIRHFDQRSINLRVYIDYTDVLSLMHGLAKMTNGAGKIDRKTYESETTLVNSLIYGGWLDSVFLTVPHQEELTHHLDIESKTDARIDHALIDLWGEGLQNIIGLNENDFQNIGSKEEYVKKLAPVADKLYKANYLLTETNWKSRFSKLVHNGRLHFDQNTENLVEIVKSEIFKKIHWGFRKLRNEEKHSKKNLTDAMALCIIQKKLSNFKEERQAFLPILFDEKNLFRKIVDLTETWSYFEVPFNGVPFRIIVDQEFLMYYALNKNEKDIELSLNESTLTSFNDFKKISFTVIDEAEKFMTEYTDVIDKFNQSRFLEKCWIRNTEEIYQLIDDLINAQHQLRNPEMVDVIEEGLAKIVKVLNATSSNFSIFKQIYDKIDNANQKIIRTFNKNLGKYHLFGHKFDVMNELSLIRFSIDENRLDEANDLIHTLLFPEDHPTNKVVNYVVENVLAAITEGRKQEQSIIVSVLILWVIEEYRLIDTIFMEIDEDYQHYSEAFVHAAAIAKKKKDDNKDNSRISGILNYVKDNPRWNPENNYKTAIAISYIYYNLWQKDFTKHFLTWLEEPKESSNIEVQKRFNEAVRYAERAITWLEDAHFDDESDRYKRAKYYYILNCKIYFITMGANNAQFFKLQKDVALLEAVQTSHPEIWEYRYHDTLALYYLRRAKNAIELKNQQKFHLYIGLADQRNDAALQYVFNNEDQEVFNNLKNKILQVTLEDGMD